MRSQQHETAGAEQVLAVAHDDGGAPERWREPRSGRDIGDSAISTRWCRF